MKNAKFVLKSKTIQGALVLLAILAKIFFGINLYSELEAGEFAVIIEQIVTGVIALISFGYTVWGRMKADKPITFKL